VRRRAEGEVREKMWVRHLWQSIVAGMWFGLVCLLFVQGPNARFVWFGAALLAIRELIMDWPAALERGQVEGGCSGWIF
jgi:hypothetical protein